MDHPVPSLALVVEDDQLQRELLSDVLKQHNMDVVQCASAEAAELVVAKVGPELRVLITDIELAGSTDGLELARFAKGQFPKLTVVVVSGQEPKSLPSSVRFVRKPWWPEDLLREAMS